MPTLSKEATMKKEQSRPRKLKLSRETLRNLEEEHLREIVGGLSLYVCATLGACASDSGCHSCFEC